MKKQTLSATAWLASLGLSDLTLEEAAPLLKKAAAKLAKDKAYKADAERRIEAAWLAMREQIEADTVLDWVDVPHYCWRGRNMDGVLITQRLSFASMRATASAMRSPRRF